MGSVHFSLACVLLSLSIINDARSINVSTTMEQVGEKKPLCLRGKVTDIQLVQESNDKLVLDVSISFEFANTSDKPIIILKHEFWLGAKTLARSAEDAAAHSVVLPCRQATNSRCCL